MGIIGVVAGLRWSVSRWEKAKGGFWVDWEREGKGLERDLAVCFSLSDSEPQMILLTEYTAWFQVALDRNFDEAVAVAPTVVCDQLSGLERKWRVKSVLCYESSGICAQLGRLGSPTGPDDTGECPDEIVWFRRDG